MAEREPLIAAFLAASGWGDAARFPLQGDASFRRYCRLARNGATAMLMDAPPPQEDVRPYLAVARALHGLDLSAPAILAADEAAGLDNFGDDTIAGGAHADMIFGQLGDAFPAALVLIGER